MALPIEAHLQDLVGSLEAQGAAVVVAPPGTGKSTRIPPALAATGRKTLVVQPRRVAARALARRVAAEQGEILGEGVGYQVRFDRCSGAKTRIEYVTDGILLRRLLAEPELPGVGAVVLDEFHERSVNMDLLLALVAEVRSTLREDLWLVVMSATLDPGPLSEFLDQAPVLDAKAPLHPVTVEFSAAKEDEQPLAPRCARGIRRLLDSPEGEGGVLAFLPGVREIEDTAQALGDLGLPVLFLHGRLKAKEQDRALLPHEGPRVILATNIAETSLTVPGITAVVDSGLLRRPRFEPKYGLSYLDLSPSSRASSEQRAGRAGRLGPGRCLRLWSTGLDQQRPAFAPPELQRSDLVGPVLTLRCWGADPHSFTWFEAPPRGDLMAADARLLALGALEPSESGYRVTELGRRLERMPLDARLGRLLLAGAASGLGACSASAAVLLQDGRMNLPEQPEDWADKVGSIPLLRRQREALLKQLDASQRQAAQKPSIEALAPVLAQAFPDRLARLVDNKSRRYELANGALVRARAGTEEPPDLIIALQLQGDARGRMWIRHALPLEAQWFETHEAIEVRFDHAKKAVVTERVTRLAGLPVDRRPGTGAAPGAVEACLLEAALKRPEQCLRWSPPATAFCARLDWLRSQSPHLDLPDLREAEPLLQMMVSGQRRFGDLKDMDLLPLLKARLSYEQQQLLKREAPATLDLPGGAPVPLSYQPGEPPVASARIQRFFGITETPSLAQGQVPIRLHLLAPNGRVAQITEDLAAFWSGSYGDVRKELRGRYPKHDWPERPQDLKDRQ